MSYALSDSATMFRRNTRHALRYPSVLLVSVLIPVLLLLLFAFLTLHTLEKMLVRGSILHFEVSAGWYDLWLLIRDPGFIVLVLAFAGKQVMDCYL